MTTHQFELAHKQIKKLSTKPGHKDRVKALMASLNMSRGENLAQAREDQLRVVGIRPNYSSYLQLAGIEQELGEYEAAQKYFDKSLEVYRNTSPFAPAYTYFHLGKMHAESIGDLHRGKIYYKEALHYVPEYVKARVHLAEIYMTEGRLDQALELLLKVKDSKDPEVPATIAEIYREQGDQEKAMPFLKKATKGYAVLLHKYELAFGDHGAEFFMGPGENPKKALELALLNLENRKSQRAFELAQEALNNAQKAQKSKNLKM